MGFRVILLRHGSTRWNRERRYQGCVDTPLSEEGRAQVDALAGLLAHRELAAVYASPLGRARETAAVIANRHRLPVRVTPEFREICLGLWEGLTIAGVEARFPDAFAAWRDHPHTVAIPDGERLDQVRERVLQGLGQLGAAHQGGTVCLVSHGVAIRLLILDALGLTPERLWSISVRPAALSELEYSEGCAVVHRLNVASHLDGLASSAGA